MVVSCGRRGCGGGDAPVQRITDIVRDVMV